MDTIVFSSWYLKLDITMPKIKALFSLNPDKMTKVVELEEIEQELVDDIARSQAHDEIRNDSLSLLYIKLDIDD